MHFNAASSTLTTPFTEAHSKAILDQLNRITSHPLFSKSTRYPRLLSYVVEKTLAQQTCELKERTIGIEVFGQANDYDTNTAPIVRYCASETRKRLALYYQFPEHRSELRIEMHPGKYTPTFWIPAQSPKSDDDRNHLMLPSRQLLNNIKRHGSETRLVILPFENLNIEERDYLTIGITEQIICRSGILHGSVAVIASPSILHSKLASKSTAQLCRELKAQYFLAGSALQVNGQTRVNVRLVSSDGGCVWTNSYTCKTLQSLTEQDRIASNIVQQLARILLPPTGLECNIPEAQRALGLGMYLLERNTESSVLKGMEQFQRALALDGRLALARSGLAFALLRHAWLGGNVEVATVYSHATNEAERAIETSPEISWPYLILATLQHGYELNEWAAAENCHRALIADPNSVHANLMLAFLHTTNGRYEEAMKFAQRAREIEPYSAYVQAFVAFNFYCARRFEEALQAAEVALQFDNNFPTALSVTGMVLEEMGQTTVALEHYKRGLCVFPSSRLFISHLGRAFALLGKQEEAAAILRQMIKGYKRDCTSSYSIAVIYAALGRTDDTLEWLERSFADRCFSRVMCRVDPRFEFLNGKSRFNDLLLKAQDESQSTRVMAIN